MSLVIRRRLGSRRHLLLVAGVLQGGQRHVLAQGALPGAYPPERLIFEIGSVTKLFTSALLARLVTEGMVHMDEPALERSRHPNPPLTLLGLATHTSGLPRLPTNLSLLRALPDNPYARYTLADLERFLADYQPKRRHIGQFRYSNLGMGLLGQALQQRLGLGYEEAVIRHICTPLGMEDTRQTLTPVQQQRRVQGYTARGRPVRCWDNPTLAGAGALFSTVEDLLRFLAANFGDVPSPLREALQLCHEPRAPRRRHGQVGIGWMIGGLHRETLLWHNGATGGANAFVGMIPARQVAAAVLFNQGPSVWNTFGLSPDPATRIGLELLSHLVER